MSHLHSIFELFHTLAYSPPQKPYLRGYKCLYCNIAIRVALPGGSLSHSGGGRGATHRTDMTDKATNAPASAAASGTSWGGWLASTAGIDSATIDSLASKASARLETVSTALETAKSTVKETATAAADNVTAAAAAAEAAAQQAADKMRESNAQAAELAKLQSTVREFLSVSGGGLPEKADTDALCSALRERGLQLVGRLETACSKGKAYKLQAKTEWEKAERAKQAAQAMHSRVTAAMAKIEQLEGVGIEALVAATPAGVGPPVIEAAATPAFLHEAESDLQRLPTASISFPDSPIAPAKPCTDVTLPLSLTIEAASFDRVSLTIRAVSH